MSRKHFSIALGVFAITLFTLAGRAVFAAESGQTPPDNIKCYYAGTFCSYPGDNYWSGCDTGFDPGMKPTYWAKQYCAEYHES